MTVETLFENKWLSLKKRGRYVYSAQSSCDSEKVAVLVTTPLWSLSGAALAWVNAPHQPYHQRLSFVGCLLSCVE